MPEPIVDYKGTRELAKQILIQDKLQNLLPVIDQEGRFTGQYYDPRTTEAPHQPKPHRLTAHIGYLQEKYGKDFNIGAGQEVPELDLALGPDELGLPEEIARLAIERSLTGKVAESMGVELPSTARIERGFGKELAATLGSFLLPADLAAFAAGGAIGGGAAKVVGAGNIISRALTSAGALGTYEGARAYYEGEDVMSASLHGAFLGGVLGVTGAATAPLGKVLQLSSEVTVLGTLPPIMEGRSPTVDDFANAAGIIVGMRVVGGIGSLSKSVFGRMVDREQRAIEERVAKGEDFAEVVEDRARSIAEQGDKFSLTVLNKIRTAKDGTEIGTIGDLIRGEGTRKFVTRAGKSPEILDWPIIVKNTAPEGSKVAAIKDGDYAGAFSVEKGKPVLYVANKIGERPVKPYEILQTVAHELQHGLRFASKRPVEKSEAKTVAEHRLEPAEQRAEKFSETLLSKKEQQLQKIRTKVRKVGGAKQYSQQLKETPIIEIPADRIEQTTGIEASRIISRITKGVGRRKGPEPESITIITQKDSGKPTKREETLFGKGNTGAVLAKHTGRKNKLFFVLTEAKDISVVDQAYEYAKSKKAELYIDKRLEKTELFKRLESENRVNRSSSKGRYLLVDPSVSRPTLSLHEKLSMRSPKGEFVKAVQSLSRRLHEAVAKIPSTKQRTEAEGRLQKLRRSISKTGQVTEKSLQAMSKSELRDASSRLQSALGDYLALQETSQASTSTIAGTKASPDITQFRVVEKGLGKAVHNIPESARLYERSKNVFSKAFEWAFQGENRAKTPEAKEIFSRMLRANYRRGTRLAEWHELMDRLPEHLKITNKKLTKEDVLESKEWQEAILSRVRTDFIEATGKQIGKRVPYFPEGPTDQISKAMRQGIQEVRAALKHIDMEGKTPTEADALVRAAIEKATLKRAGFRDVVIEIDGKKVKALEGAVEHLVRTGEAKSLTDAILKIQEDTAPRELFVETRYEKRRRLSYPSQYYETRPQVVIPQYLESMAKRIAEAEQFGPNGETFVRLMDRVESSGNLKERDILREIAAKWTGQYNLEHGFKGIARDAVDVYTAYQVFTKIMLGQATILNFMQWAISFFPRVGSMNVIRGGVDTLNAAKRAQVKKAGIVESMDEQALRASLGEVPGGVIGRIAQKGAKYSGFSAINKFNLYWAALSFNRAATQWVKQAQGAGPIARLRQKQLAQFGIDYKNPPKGEALWEKTFQFAQDSQLLPNILKEPLFLNETKLRPLFLFKRFGIRQALLMKDIIAKDVIQNRNIMPLLRLGVAGYFGGGGMVWALNKIKSIIGGEPMYEKSDSLTDEFFTRIGMIGAFGMMSDIMSIEKMSKLPDALKFVAAPVIVADAEKLAQVYTRFMSDWERYDDAFLAAKRNVYGLTGVLGTYPRQAGKRLRTESQKERATRYWKGRERIAILELLMEGQDKRASDRLAKWNETHKEREDKLQWGDVSPAAMREYLEKKMEETGKAAGLEGPELLEFQKERRQKINEKLREAARIAG